MDTLKTSFIVLAIGSAVITGAVTVERLPFLSRGERNEIKTYIKDALANGCKPVIDIGDNTAPINWGSVPLTCRPLVVSKVNPKTVQGLYLEIAEEYSITARIEEYPYEIRKKMQEEGRVILPAKKELNR